MKKIFGICLVLFVMSVNANAQQKFEDGIYRKRETLSVRTHAPQNQTITTDVNLQERTNGENYFFSNSSATYLSPTLWHFNNLTEQWSGFKKDMVLQTKSFQYNNKTHYVLYYQYENGHYKYPHSKVGYYTYTAHMYILLSEEEYNNFVNCNGYCEFDLYYWTNTANGENQIIRELMTKRHSYSVKFVIQSNKDIVRFDFSEFHGGTIVSGIDCQNQLKTTYFEVTRKEWDRLKLN